MSVKSWNLSETVIEARRENPDPSPHILLKEVVLDAGKSTPQVIGSIITYVVVIAITAASLVIAKRVLWGLGCACPAVDAVLSIMALCCYPVLIDAIHKWRTIEFVVVGGVLEGVDLWNVERVRYSRHSVWLDDALICGIPNTKVFLKSLEDYYYQLTGVELP